MLSQDLGEVQALPQRKKRARRQCGKPKTEAPAGDGLDDGVDDGLMMERKSDDTPVVYDEVSVGDAGGDGGESNGGGGVETRRDWGDRVLRFEYLDHTADVQLHSWGSSLEEAFENSAIAMFGYMTELSSVSIDESMSFEFEAKGHDMQSLLYAFLDEMLFAFSTEPFMCCRDVRITHFDRVNFKITAVGRGEPFDLSKHPQGTEVKAITYCAMQIYLDWKPRNEEEAARDGAEFPFQIFVVIDI